MINQQQGNPNLIIFSLWLLVFAASSQIMIISPILPRISEQLQTPEALLGSLVTAYAAMVGLFAILSGPFSDKMGRRQILIIGSLAMAVALLLHGFIINFTTFLIFRALAGMAGGVLSGSAISYVGDYFVYERRGWASGWIMSGIAMGQILGIPLGTVLADFYDFRTPFLVFGGVMLIAFILVLFIVPQPSVTLDDSKITLRMLVNKYLDLLNRKVIRAASLAYLLMFLGLSIYVVYLPTWLEQHFDVGGLEIASLFLIGGIANVIAGPQAGRFSDKWGRKSLIITSCIGLSCVMFFTTILITSFWLSYPLFFITMILVAMRISPFQALSTELVTSSNRGTLMSLLIAIGQIGYGVGGAFSGPIYVHLGYFSSTCIGALCMLLTAAIIWIYLPEPDLRKDLS